MYTSTPVDVPDPPFRFFEGLAPRLLTLRVKITTLKLKTLCACHHAASSCSDPCNLYPRFLPLKYHESTLLVTMMGPFLVHYKVGFPPSPPQHLHPVAGGSPLQLLVPAASAGVTVVCFPPRHLVLRSRA